MPRNDAILRYGRPPVRWYKDPGRQMKSLEPYVLPEKQKEYNDYDEVQTPDPVNSKRGGAIKSSKAQAHYRLGSKKRRCDLCTMFRAPNSCTAVTGTISPRALCDFFKRKQAFAEGGEVDPLTGIPVPDDQQQNQDQSQDYNDVPGVGYVPTTAPNMGPSWLQQAKTQTEKDIAAYQSHGVPGLMAENQGTQDLAGGFGGTTTPAARTGPLAQNIARAIERTHGNDIPAISNRFTELYNGGISQDTLDKIFGHLPPETQLGLIEHEANGIPKPIQRESQPSGPLNLDTFFKHASPSEVEHLTRSDLASLDQQLRASEEPYRYHQENRELFEALERRLDKEKPKEFPKPNEEFEQAYNQPQRNFSNLDELEQAVQRQFQQVPYEPPQPRQSMSPTEFAMARAESDYNAAQQAWRNAGTDAEATAAYNRLQAAQRVYSDARIALEREGPDFRDALAGQPSPGQSRRESGHPFRTVSDAKAWLKDNGHNPKDWGYSDQSDYITLANQLSGREATRVATPTPHPNEPIANGELLTPSQFFGMTNRPSDVLRLTDNQLSHLGEHLLMHQEQNSGVWKNINNYQPDLLSALRGQIAERQAAGNFHDPELDSLMETFSNIGTTQPLPARVVRPLSTPASEPPPGPFRRLTQSFYSYFDNFLKPTAKVKDVDELGKKMFGDQNTKSISGDVYISPEYNTPTISFKGRLKGPNGENWGDIHRSIFPEKKFAYHNLFEATKEAREKGIPAKILRSQIDLYKQMGLTHVDVTAGLESGPYAWLKYGFVPTKSAWETIRHNITNKIINDDIHITDPTTKDAVLRILENSNPRTAWDLADFKGTDKYGNSIGPLAMLGSNLEKPKGPSSYIMRLRNQMWRGSLLLNDAAVMARFNKYVSRKPKKPE